MTSPRPFRAGLGLPEAVVIRSGPVSASHLADQHYEPTDRQSWKEWTVNPAKHGPERLTRAPVFLPSKQQYDDLGRSLGDGVGIEVDQGDVKVPREVDDGDRVSAWYTQLASRPTTGSSTPGSGPSDLRPKGPPAIVDLTDLDDEDEDELKMEPPSTIEAEPLRVNRNEWYIRRALLRRCQLEGAPRRPLVQSKPSSIGRLVEIDLTKPLPAQPVHYVLGPENKGYAMLKDRLGWEGGGLGRPVGWLEPTTLDCFRQMPEAGPSRLASQLKAEIEEDAESQIRQREAGAAETIVDLTAASDGEDDDFDEDAAEPPRQGGPGRTAPIATALKLDRLGIGHIRSTRPGNPESVKKVTHTAKEIAQARQRAKYAGKPMSKLELGKKGKMKWSEKEKREREHRQRLAAAINA
ncbi:hypothetical protein BD324DRAFT_611413 [Kockovaella imperatae]|uniref:G-patch domain-containing protein n=1 Tax=Kockovaella imperatae TaxID=4999 RepID=A0A1Y1URB6_9TREE|nr:hypothetical protein BD324DRAFT_611413 [Kockovaella imperatae]ORX40590.1 hypothetical protein BD324DRAFT_611413 [Kockovaella imperatae]